MTTPECKDSDHAKTSCSSCCCGSGKKKKIIMTVVVAAIVLVVALVIVLSSLGKIIKTGVQTVGSQVTKSPITVDNIDLSLLRGQLVIDNLVIGNPDGYKTDSAMQLGKVLVKLDPKSIFSDTIHIYEVIVDAPQITYERSLTNSNIGVIQDNVDAFLPKGDGKDKEDDKEEKKPGKKVVIDHVTVSNGQIKLSSTLLQGAALPVPLPTVALSDIGKEKAVSPPEASAQVLKKVLGSVIDAATEAIKKLTGSAGDVLKSVTGGMTGEKATAAGKDVQEAAAQVEEKAAEVGKDVKQAADNVKKAAGGLLKSITGGKDAAPADAQK